MVARPITSPFRKTSNQANTFSGLRYVPLHVPPDADTSLTQPHQIIALHRASERNGAEFYPSCVQVQVGGNGDGVPNTTVTFSNAYSDDDPGIYIPQVRTAIVYMSNIVDEFCADV